MKRVGKDDSSSSSNPNEEKLTVDGGVTKTILKEGKGDTVPDNVEVKVHYIGRLKDGSIFDESYKRKQPFTFAIGKRNVILGWDIGVKTMKIGEKAILKCHPDYAYGNRAIGPIPPNSTLYFEVELLDWRKADDDNILYALVVIIVMVAIFYFLFDRLYPRTIA